jgi:DNA-binding transcriptional regulator YhcF (GntR family)
VRQLARDLGVAPNTIARAYDELARAGWIGAAPRKGYVVASVPPGAWDAERAQRLRGEIERQLSAGAHAAPAPPAPDRPAS